MLGTELLGVGWERKSADRELFRSMLIDGGEARLSCSLFTSAACESLHYRWLGYSLFTIAACESLHYWNGEFGV